MKKTKSRLTTLILALLFLVGLGLVLYPTVSDYWNSLHSSRAIASYSQQVANIDNDMYDRLWESAFKYNEDLAKKENQYVMDDPELYRSLLDIGGGGVMGYIEIPAIAVSLPIYHGTEDSVLQIAAGHIEWSSLPVGGIGSHSVLSGHRGLPSAKLFTDLDKLTVGDEFMICVLDEVLTYEIDQILIVLPQETGALLIDHDHDYCTLVTCTPYGINSHRLLVRGHRIETEEATRAAVRVTADAMQIQPSLIAPFLAVPLIIILLIVLFIGDKQSAPGVENVYEKYREGRDGDKESRKKT